MGRKRPMTTHHRKARAFGGKSVPENVSRVPEHKHRAFHLLFGAGDPSRVAMVLNKYWLDPEYFLVVIKKGESDEQKQCAIKNLRLSGFFSFDHISEGST